MHKCLLQSPQGLNNLSLLCLHMYKYESCLRNSRSQALRTRNIFLSNITESLEHVKPEGGIIPSYLQTYCTILG